MNNREQRDLFDTVRTVKYSNEFEGYLDVNVCLQFSNVLYACGLGGGGSLSGPDIHWCLLETEGKLFNKTIILILRILDVER